MYPKYYKHLVTSHWKNCIVKCVHLSHIVNIQAGRQAGGGFGGVGGQLLEWSLDEPKDI